MKKEISKQIIENWKKWNQSSVILKGDKLRKLTSQQEGWFSSLPLITKNDFRAKVQLGTNGFNLYNIKVIILAWIKLTSLKPGAKIIICHDQRKTSNTVKNYIGQILNNFQMEGFVLENNEVAPTPFLSYLLSANYPLYQQGIMITASHNKKEINGIKFIDGQGYPWEAKKWETLQKLVNDSYWKLLSTPIKKLKLNNNWIKSIEKDKYLAKIQEVWINNQKPRKTRVLFSSLHGTTINWTDLLLEKSGYQVDLVKKQCILSPDFPTLEDPNPENKNAFDYALKASVSKKTDLIIINDCDGDRMRIAVKDHKEKFHPLSGNEIALIFSFFLLKEKKRKGYLYRSLVSNKTIDQIAKSFDSKVIVANTGFNSLSEQYKKQGKRKFVFAFEESLGYLPDITITQNKDGLQAALLICEIAEFCKKKGKTLLEYLAKIQQTYGYSKHKVYKEQFNAKNWKKYKSIINKIKKIAQKEIIEKKYIAKANTFFLSLENNVDIAIRPSQTEPIIKFYFNVYENKENLLDIKLNNIKKSFYEIMKIKTTDKS